MDLVSCVHTGDPLGSLVREGQVQLGISLSRDCSQLERGSLFPRPHRFCSLSAFSQLSGPLPCPSPLLPGAVHTQDQTRGPLRRAHAAVPCPSALDEHWGKVALSSLDPAWFPHAPAKLCRKAWPRARSRYSNEKHAVNSTTAQPTGDRRVNAIALEGCK